MKLLRLTFVVAVLLVLSACGWNSEPMPADNRRPRENRLDEIERRRQNRVAECMHLKGFDYVALEPSVAAFQSGPGPIAYAHEPGSDEWFRYYGLGVTTLAAPQKDLEDGLIGIVYEAPPSKERNPNIRIVESLTDEEKEAWERTLSECLMDVNRLLSQETTSERVRPDIGQQAERLTLEKLKVHPDVAPAVDQFAECMKEAGFPIEASASIQLAGAELVMEIYGELVDKLQFQRGPLSPIEVETLREAQAWERKLGASLIDCGMRDLNAIIRPIADNIRQVEIERLTFGE